MQPIIDAHIPVTNNYIAGGIVNHNSGKTIAGGYETALHATGLYPEWWDGWRSPRLPRIWCAGSTTETTRDIVQAVLFGPSDNIGSGMIPKHLIGDIKKRPNTGDAFDSVNVKNDLTGAWVKIGLKSYEQGSRAFEGTEKEFVWLDEEPPLKIYTECLTRTATTDGRIAITFTPLGGITEVVRSFMADGVARV